MAQSSPCAAEGRRRPKVSAVRGHRREYGIEGDWHSGPMRSLQRRDRGEPPPRLVGGERGIRRSPSWAPISRRAGSARISSSKAWATWAISPRAVLRFSSGVELEVTAQNDPCKNLLVYHNQIPKRSVRASRRAGRRAADGRLEPGDTVSVVSEIAEKEAQGLNAPLFPSPPMTDRTGSVRITSIPWRPI